MQLEDAGRSRWASDAIPAIVKLGVAGVARLALGEIDTGSLRNGMDMAVTGKETGVAAGALTTFADGRTETAAVGRIVAGGAAESGMGLASGGER